jgi:UDP-N-acetylglucosamine--N-acetylmuramyl-(pentapeptide) pyrophosphoryl-undecaprenol N-acetylglucosamine transferase
MILFVSGATGGHLYPAIAMAQQLNSDSLFVVSRAHPAQDILRPYLFKCMVLGLGRMKVLGGLISVVKAIKIIKQQRPKVVVAMGGGICVPFGVAAWISKCPMVSFEQNALPGRATRINQFFSSCIITAFESAIHEFYLKSKVRCLGNPIRFKPVPERDLPKEWELLDSKTLLIIGGSQGARALNEFVINYRNDIMHAGLNIIHLTGTDSNGGVEHYRNRVYIPIPYLNNMDAAYRKTMVVMCRSGATTISELRHFNLPCILVPYPYAKDNHQQINAQCFLNETNAGEILPQNNLTLAAFMPVLARCMSLKMPKNVHNAPQVLTNVCELLKSYLK